MVTWTVANASIGCNRWHNQTDHGRFRRLNPNPWTGILNSREPGVEPTGPRNGPERPRNQKLAVHVIRILLCLAFAGAALPLKGASAVEPLTLHPDNPHYFLFRSKPAILVSSGEHYGAVLNLDFDYGKYLTTLAANGLNLTRTFPGAYVEPAGAFNIERNTLAPARGRLICPWARSETPGYINGGNRFDLARWDTNFFERLKDFVTRAGSLGIVVELNLFTPMYEDSQWSYSPMNAANNINGVGKVGKHEVYTIDKEPALLAVQDALVRKIVTELNGFDNLYYEICNEPYFGGVTPAWHDHIADVIVTTEKSLPAKHLISWNVANDHARIRNPNPAISIFNFHYARPEAAADNYGLDKVLGLNETGFKGTGDDYYRKQAWEFLLAGGALYNNLDYSFCAGHEDGTFPVKPPTPGGGSPRLRKQVRLLGDFLRTFDFIHMKPASGAAAVGQRGICVLAEAGKQYAVYVPDVKNPSLELQLPRGSYQGEWLDAVSGSRVPVTLVDHPGGRATFKSPHFQQDGALRLVRK
jgi:Cellulase (glycosyl hydrolase family 5)